MFTSSLTVIALCQCKRLLDKGSTDGAVLEKGHAAVTHAGVSAGQQHPVHCCILTHHTVSALRPLWPVLLLHHWDLILALSVTGCESVPRISRPRHPPAVSRHEKRLQETSDRALLQQFKKNLSAWQTGDFHTCIDTDRDDTKYVTFC